MIVNPRVKSLVNKGHKMSSPDIQLWTAIGETFRPECFIKANVTYKNKTKNME